MMVWLTGMLWALGIFLLLRRSLVRVLIGINVLGHAANLSLFVAGGLRPEAAFLPLTGSAESVADPLPQALILTAIVIGFGLVSFAVVVLGMLWKRKRVSDADEIRGVDA